MRDYVITVNSTVDVPKLWLEERHVPVVALKYTIDGETYTDMELSLIHISEPTRH